MKQKIKPRREPKKFDQNWLKECVAQAEANGGLANQGELWDKAAALYNTKVPANMKPVMPSFVRLKVLELNLPIKTVSGRDKASAVNVKVLQECITAVEAQGVCRTWSELFAKVAALYNPKTQQSCSGSTLQNVAVKQQLEIEMPKGKRGGNPSLSGIRGVRTKKADKFASSPAIQLSLERLRKTIPPDKVERYGPLVDQVVAGSRSAAVKLKCLDCSCFNTAEIKHCSVTDCALWAFRPYQGGAVEEGDVLEIEQVEQAVA